MAWTKQQQDAINSTGRSVIVSAAAGSGKTAVLVERLTQQIISEESPVRADKIIIVTFTNDAAAELRQRINSKLQSIINENPENRFLLKQYTLFQNARISTIHSFCFDLIRNNTENLDITSGFSILDETENAMLENRAAEETMSLWSEKYPEKYGLLYDKFCMKNDENIKQIIFEMNTFLSSIPKREQWIDNTRREFKKDYRETVYYKKFVRLQRKNLQKALETAEENLAMTDNMFREINEKTEELRQKLVFQTSSDINLIVKCIDSLEGNPLPDAVFERLPSKRGIEVSEIYKKNREKCKAAVNEYISGAEYIKEDIEENGRVFSVLSEFLLDFYDILWQKKCERNALSFDDSEKIVIDMLADYDSNGNIIQSETAKELSAEYDIIMIDEYQDSNNKQDMIFKLLSHNFRQDETGRGIYGDNVFLVGDVKQSIYRFRLANPDNFIETFKKSEPYEKNPESKNVSICLNKNFRSSGEVIDYCNYVFELLMSEKCGDIKYDENEKLYAEAEEYKKISYDRKTEITMIESEMSDDDTDESEENAVEYAENDATTDPEAEYTAEKIAYMIKNKFLAVRKNGKAEPCEPKDFCILMRETKYAKRFTEALKKRGIYARGEEEKGYLKSREIVILLDILRIIDNPLLDIPTAAVLMSPMFIFTAQEVAEIRAIDCNARLYITIVKIADGEYDSEHNISDLLKYKCHNFIDTIRNFRMFSIIYTIEELIEEIYNTTDFLNIMQQFVDGEKKKANLRALVQYAKSYEANSNSGGLSGFLRYIDRIIEDDADLPQGKISAVSENYVSIKTIHKSKGLEYPFIFLAKTEIKFKDDSRKTVMCSQNNEIGFKLNEPQYMRRVKTVPFEQLYTETTKKSVSEELRLLYVALTRAKQKLFINVLVNEKRIENVKKLNDTLAEKEFDIASAAPFAKSLSDWIWLTLLCHSKFAEISERYSMDIENKVQYDNDLFDIKYFSKAENNFSEEKEENISADSEIIAEIKEIMNYEYDFSRSEIPAKMSVTQFLSQSRSSSDKSVVLSQPQFILENTNKASGAERGTVIHRFFQFVDFNCNPDEIEDEIQSMADKNYFTEDESKLIPVDKIKAFLKSDICRRIRSAENTERERNFMIEINELGYRGDVETAFANSDGMIVGIIDLIIEEKDGLVIVDYKSDRGASEKKLAEKYSEQLNIYKAALELITGKKVKEKILYSVELEKEIYL